MILLLSLASTSEWPCSLGRQGQVQRAQQGSQRATPAALEDHLQQQGTVCSV